MRFLISLLCLVCFSCSEQQATYCVQGVTYQGDKTIGVNVFNDNADELISFSPYSHHIIYNVMQCVDNGCTATLAIESDVTSLIIDSYTLITDEDNIVAIFIENNTDNTITTTTGNVLTLCPY